MEGEWCLVGWREVCKGIRVMGVWLGGGFGLVVGVMLLYSWGLVCGCEIGLFWLCGCDLKDIEEENEGCEWKMKGLVED